VQVEFVGLPGCGKSTVLVALEQRMKAGGVAVQGLRNAARAAMQQAEGSVSFLRRRGERTSLYGCMLWAHENPDLFQRIFRLSHTDFISLIWGMESLSQQGIISKHGAKDLIILNDEGFLQRIAWNFIEHGTQAEIEEICQLLDPGFITLHLTLDAKDALGRAKNRRKGVPIGLKGKDEADSLLKFQRYGGVLDSFVAARQAQSRPVLVLDASSDIDRNVDAIMVFLHPLLPQPVTEKPGVQKP
jgi:thymidylate kinase